ncbi:hypothetical protein ACTOB_004826 [Actinoplanes oblitus]|uniref:Uncharacterized protein n=1 Tax=Actinoplanes oblitus TaxID=3040509 RepID=A0ABY8W756_9ACTN|nr:hypothetical protein [Actinoplanes oblitus]WIM92868.1 hypothetical protein ACTOB_004826 [Actinoplanes oblitus]
MTYPATMTLPGQAAELSACDRTDLLRRMLVLRHLAVLRHSPSRGAEAVLAGIRAALSPSDTIRVVGGRPSPDQLTGTAAGVTVWLAHFGGNGGPDRICALFAHQYRDRVQRQLAVDGWDAEAVLAASAGAARVVRTWGAARLLTLRTAARRGRRDPIAVLATRMRLARQLDDGTFRALELDARRIANRLSRDRGFDSGLAALATAADELAPRFAPGVPEAAGEPPGQRPRR